MVSMTPSAPAQPRQRGTRRRGIARTAAVRQALRPPIVSVSADTVGLSRQTGKHCRAFSRSDGSAF
jgi:hypothetical protein